MSYAPVPQILHDTKEHLRKIAVICNSSQQGKLNAVSQVTLAANTATTTITDSRLGVNSFVGFMPKTAHSATELATMYVDTQNTGSAVIHHANNAQTDRSFNILIIG